MTAWTIFWWIVLPYMAMVIFIVGHVWRWRYDQFGWTSRSTQLQERKWLKWGSPIFHYGAFTAIGGHILGILIPKTFTNFLGISEGFYHGLAAWAGTVAAVLVIVGMGFLAARRVFAPKVRATTSPVDWVALVALGIVVVLGIIPTIMNLVGTPYDYRETVSLWFRGLFTADPNVHLVENAPIMYQIHAISAWVLFAIWPFTRLVHVWSYPLWYLWRPYIIYRSRKATKPNEPGTGGRKWRKIGVPY